MACRGFRKAVQCWCRRYTNLPKDEERLPRDVDFLLRHLSHCIRQLNSKRQSLQNGLRVLQETLWPQVLDRFRNATAKERPELLQHFLVQCLRLHDGILLLISGECRHVGDIRAAKKTKFPSRLPEQDLRSDGYTKLYQAPGGYSGFGFDEYNDPEVGIRLRMLQALRRYSKKRKSEEQIADFLADHGGAALDSWLERNESQMTVVHQEFIALRDRVTRDLREAIGKNGSNNSQSSKSVKVAFNLHDKMEKLQVGNISLERRGNAFQVLDPKGALPNGYTIKDWESIMKLSEPLKDKNSVQRPKRDSSKTQVAVQPAGNKVDPPKGRKRRRVIEESDSEDDEKSKKNVANKQETKENSKNKAERQQTPIKAKSTGLNVKIWAEPKPPPTPGEGKSYSLASIKSQMGADVAGLEASREELEREEAGASKAAKVDEAEAEDATINVRQAEATVRTAESRLNRVLSRNDLEEYEIWDVRETLREALMVAGNIRLWEKPTGENEIAEDRLKSLERAYRYFLRARKIVDDQEKLHRNLVSQNKSFRTPDESRYVLRNLFLMRGRAQTNLGIARVEQATHSKKKTNYITVDSKRYLREAVDELNAAKECAEALRTQALVDRGKGSDYIETDIDIVRADQLDSLGTRWMATAMWHQGIRRNAIDLFDSNANVFLKRFEAWKSNAVDDDSLQDARLQLGSECYYACTTLADLASSSLERLPPSGAVKKGDDLFSRCRESLKKASQVSEAIRELIESHPNDKVTYEDFSVDNEVMSFQSIEQYLSDVSFHLDSSLAGLCTCFI